eukprot:3513791-Prymnesium_polylepis.1
MLPAAPGLTAPQRLGLAVAPGTAPVVGGRLVPGLLPSAPLASLAASGLAPPRMVTLPTGVQAAALPTGVQPTNLA